MLSQMIEKGARGNENFLSIYQCGYEKCLPCHDYGPAVRDHYLIHYVVSGKGTFCVNKKEYLLEPGRCFIIVPGVLSYYQADCDDPWEYFWVGFNGDTASDIVKRCGFTLADPILKVSGEKAAADALSAILTCFSEDQKSFSAFSKLYAFFDILSKSVPKAYTTRNDAVNDAIEYINRSYSYDISVDSIARHVGLCRSQLFRQFKEALGVSPQEYLVGYRMERAHTLLRTTNLSVTEVMYSSGYQNINNFSKIFKKTYGQSPLRLRQSAADCYDPCKGR